jgi:hypothetical protein
MGVLDSDQDYEHVRDVLTNLKDNRHGWELAQVDPVFEQWRIRPR